MANTNRDVAHVWAAHNMGTTTKDYARSSNGNFSFDGPSLYSYSTEIARFMRSRNGTRWVLVNEARFSVTTTGKHYPAMRAALHGLGLQLIRSVQPKRSTPLVPTLSYPESGEDIQAIAMQRVAACDYGAAQFLAREYDFTIEGLEEMARRAIAAREGVIAWDNLRKFFANYFHASGEFYDRPLRALADISRGVEWLATPNPTYYRFGFGGPTLLRVNGDTVETSRGATFPLEHGLKALPVIERCRARQTGLIFTDPGPRLGHFRVDHVDPHGTVKAGCHTVPYFAIRWAARMAGAIDAPELDHVARAVLSFRIARGHGQPDWQGDDASPALIAS